MESSRLEVGAVFRAYHATPFLSGGIQYIFFACHRELPLIHLRHSATTCPTGSSGRTSQGFPYVVEVEHNGSAIFRQPLGMQFTPTSDVLLYLLTGGSRLRHFAGECAHDMLALSLLSSTMSKG
jgi:hypothetical protein